MKKIGVISDIHGNLPALKAILALLDDLGCEEIIHTGDVVCIGPQSKDCLHLLLSRPDVTLLMGNHDKDFVQNVSQVKHLSHVPQQHKMQVFDSLTQADRQKVAQFATQTTRICGGAKIMFMHYALTDKNATLQTEPLFEPLQMTPTAQLFDGMFNKWQCDAVFFGHKHEPCDIVGDKLYVDVGSVGCHPRPFARGIVIQYDDDGWQYSRVEAPYDMQQTQRNLCAMPHGVDLYNFYYLRLKPTANK